MRSLLIAALSALLAAPAAAQTTLRIGIGADPNVLDPAQSGSFVERVVFAALCDKLVDVAPDLSFRPELAMRWEWAPDGRALTLTLREGARFHDGTPVDAAAVVVSPRAVPGRKGWQRGRLVPAVRHGASV
jgi:peptide/nickel transport system substrate-binding protein